MDRMKRLLMFVLCAVFFVSGWGSLTPGFVPVLAQTNDPVFVGAGDIASCSRTQDEETAKLLDNIPGTVFTLGDNAYPDGTLAQFNNCYQPTWGRHKSRTRPVPGNHDYHVSGATGYFDYFGSATGDRSKGYYSYNLGAWHIIALNSEITRGAGSAQEQWLRADLAANPKVCTLAYWHKPLFSSGHHGNNRHMQDIWRTLSEFNVDVVVAGHDHMYERFAPQDADGRLDPVRGIRQFIVGTGGAPVYQVRRLQPNSEARGHEWGVLVLNASTMPVRIAHGDRIAQLILARFEVLRFEPGVVVQTSSDQLDQLILHSSIHTVEPNIQLTSTSSSSSDS